MQRGGRWTADSYIQTHRKLTFIQFIFFLFFVQAIIYITGRAGKQNEKRIYCTVNGNHEPISIFEGNEKHLHCFIITIYGSRKWKEKETKVTLFIGCMHRNSSSIYFFFERNYYFFNKQNQGLHESMEVFFLSFLFSKEKRRFDNDCPILWAHSFLILILLGGSFY